MDDPPEKNWVQQNEQDMGLEEGDESSSSSSQQELQDEKENEEESEPESERQQQQHEEEEEALPPPPVSDEQPTSDPVPPFDPSRMIGIIRRKSLIKELAAMYHAECLSYCQELLELQRKGDEPLVAFKYPEELKDAMRPPKRSKKTARH